MQQRKLGKNGPSVGAMGLGCMSFAGFYGPTDEAEAHATLDTCREMGVTHLDTARVYGMGLSEEIIGSYLKKTGATFSIATKGGIEHNPRRFVNSKQDLTEHLEGSLKRLGLDYVDLYYVHRRQQEIPIEDVVETLVGFKERGMIGGIGFSEISPASLRRAHAVHPVMAVQSEYSLWSRMPELGMIQTCAELGVAFVAFSPVARGMFSDRFPVPAEFADGDFRKNNPRFVEPNFSHNAAAIQKFKDLAADWGYSPAGLAIAWTLHQGKHVIPIPGTRSSAHLEQDAEGTSISLSSDDLAAIEAILPRGFAHGDRYSDAQIVGVERYC